MSPRRGPDGGPGNDVDEEMPNQVEGTPSPASAIEAQKGTLPIVTPERMPPVEMTREEVGREIARLVDGIRALGKERKINEILISLEKILSKREAEEIRRMLENLFQMHKKEGYKMEQIFDILLASLEVIIRVMAGKRN